MIHVSMARASKILFKSSGALEQSAQVVTTHIQIDEFQLTRINSLLPDVMARSLERGTPNGIFFLDAQAWGC